MTDIPPTNETTRQTTRVSAGSSFTEDIPGQDRDTQRRAHYGPFLVAASDVWVASSVDSRQFVAAGILGSRPPLSQPRSPAETAAAAAIDDFSAAGGD